MTSTVEPLLPPARPTRYDRLVSRIARNPVLAARWRWLAPLLVTLVAGILRFWNLANPHALVFDETYYVKDAWTQWNLGYSAEWQDDADEKFAGGQSDVFRTAGSFIVHPPLGKWLIGLGMWIFGPESSFGWRVAVAVFGTAAVLLLYLVAKTLTGSIPFATVASGLMAIDGLAIVLSRIALLDIFLTFFILLAFWFVLLDRRRYLERMQAAVERQTVDGIGPAWGPVVWNRPWIVAAGAAAGAATAVKWSGLYVIAGIAIYLIVTDALARRRAGVRQWPLDAVREGLVAGVLALPIAFVVYLVSWTGWLVTDGGYGRHAVDASPATGFWSWVPLPLQNLWAYHEAIYGFHVGLVSPHSYASPAWQWPLLIRPTSMYYQGQKLGEAGCGVDGGCVQNVYSMPNPLIWYASVAAAIYLIWRFIVVRDWRYAFVLTGIAVTYLPWLLYPERTIFQFYTIAILPFLLLALAFALRDIATGPPDAPPHRRLAGQRVVWVYLAVVVVLSAFWYPILTAMDIPYEFWRLHNWMQTWV